MAVHEGPTSFPGDNAPPHPLNQEVSGPEAGPSASLRIHHVVSHAPDGTTTAAVALVGELCALTAPMLGEELDRLLDRGVVGVVIELGELSLCTSDGLDLFVQCQTRLQQTGGGTVELHGAVGVVARVLQLAHDLDPQFSLRVELGGNPRRASPIDSVAAGMTRLLAEIDEHLTAAARNREDTTWEQSVPERTSDVET